MKALEGILEQFKSGTLTLEQSLNLFESGVGHLKVCQEKLTVAKGKVEELVRKMQEDGEAVTRPFEESV
jgi:exodeoxyribonuclease VII small subunit